MKKHPLRAALVAFSALLVLTATLLCVFGFALPAQYTQTFLGELPCKLERLRQAESPRIILVGGSSVPFAVKSELIEQALPGYSVVDFGLYAELGTVLMTELLEGELRAGDIVILMPEQASQTLSAEFSAEAVWQAVDGNFELLRRLSSDRYEKLLAAFPVFAGKKCYYTLFGAPVPDGIYAKASFNAYSDIDSPLREANIMAGGFDPNQCIFFSASVLSDDLVQRFDRFAAEAAAVGASVYYHFAPMNRAAVAQGSDIDGYYDLLRSKLSFPILGDPNRSILESGWFYDTNFHLNASGAIVFTKVLIEDLKILLSDTSPTDIALPPMPNFTDPDISDGDNSCEHCFRYRQAENGWIVDALTDAGRDAQALVIPVSHEGQRVIGIDEDLFVGNTTLRELTVQGNIGTLYDGMFRGCLRMRRLILTAEAPASYTVGDGLMQGADFLICVPAAALEQYRRHYTWQHYNAYLIAAE